jgi:plasmid stabilization system protein ParE
MPASRLLRTAVTHSFAYEELRSGVRRALTKQFPYAVYFSVEEDTVLIVAVLHTARDPAEWQQRL